MGGCWRCRTDRWRDRAPPRPRQPKTIPAGRHKKREIWPYRSPLVLRTDITRLAPRRQKPVGAAANSPKGSLAVRPENRSSREPPKGRPRGATIKKVSSDG